MARDQLRVVGLSVDVCVLATLCVWVGVGVCARAHARLISVSYTPGGGGGGGEGGKLTCTLRPFSVHTAYCRLGFVL